MALYNHYILMVGSMFFSCLNAKLRKVNRHVFASMQNIKRKHFTDYNRVDKDAFPFMLYVILLSIYIVL